MFIAASTIVRTQTPKGIHRRRKQGCPIKRRRMVSARVGVQHQPGVAASGACGYSPFRALRTNPFTSEENSLLRIQAR